MKVKSSDLRPDRFFLAAGLLYGLVFLVVTPPFQVPDEPVHFFRAYRVSEGRLDLLPWMGTGSAEIPSSLHEIAAELLGGLPYHAERKVAPQKILAAFRVPLAIERRAPVWFAGSLQYPFVSYVPPALGVALGRAVGAPPLALLYFARLANLAAGTLMIYFALRRLPAFQWLAAMIALTPMALSLRASASADVTATGAAFLLAAGVAGMAWGEGTARRNDLALVLTSSALLCASKAVYVPLAFLVILIPAVRFPTGGRGPFVLCHSLISLAAAAFGVAFNRVVGSVRYDAAVDAVRQIQHALLHPFDFLKVLANDYVTHGSWYLAQFVGQLGWLDTKLPMAFILAYLGVLLAMLLVDASPRIEVRPWQRWLVASLTLSAMVLISASQYAAWTPFGAKHIEGIQGRYFIPLAPAAVWVFHTRTLVERAGFRNPGPLLAGFSLLSFGISVWALVTRFYVS
ncbi:MAG TPA: DUF2142 domain-containing protein [Thermoanaerobaculia bacterium]|jgi:hypothetical protein|nr:DUF2142 domain-containing protein [Thermoanaerobaculia bacterium]